eukprot:6405843-Alexandrium_andersonii.AAC.1
MTSVVWLSPYADGSRRVVVPGHDQSQSSRSRRVSVFLPRPPWFAELLATNSLQDLLSTGPVRVREIHIGAVALVAHSADA